MLRNKSKESENMVELFNVDFSRSRYLEQQTKPISQLEQTLHNLNNIRSTIQRDPKAISAIEQINDMDLNTNSHEIFNKLGSVDIPFFNKIRQKVNNARINGNGFSIDINLNNNENYQNIELLTLGLDIKSYYKGTPLYGMAVYNDGYVFEFYSLEDLLLASKGTHSPYSLSLAFEIDQRFPFLSCDCCGCIKPYYADPLVNKEPYGLCDECEKNYNQI